MFEEADQAVTGLNEYSTEWFRTFDPKPAHTETQINLLLALTRPDDSIVDVGCGTGRHTNPLARFRRRVIGLDTSTEALKVAREDAPPAAQYVAHDMRHPFPAECRGADLVLFLWQTFGFFDRSTNMRVLDHALTCLREGGSILLDIYNPAYWRKMTEDGQRSHTTMRAQQNVDTSVSLETVLDAKDDMLSVTQKRASHTFATFKWRLYEPDWWASLERRRPIQVDAPFTQFDPSKPPSEHDVAYQVILHRS